MFEEPKQTPTTRWGEISVAAEAHLDPKKADPKQEDAARHAHDEAIKEKIGCLDLDGITEVINNIEKAIRENPSLLQEQGVKEKIERAHQRLAEILKQNEVEILH